MNRLKFWKITAPIMGVAALGTVGGAVGYYFYKTAPEKWNNALQDFREVHLGFDGNQMIGYLAAGQFDDGTGKDKLVTWEEEETSKVVYVKNEQTKEVTKFELDSKDKEKSIIYTLPGKQGDKFTIAVESKGITFRNQQIRLNAFKNAPDITDAKTLRTELKKHKDADGAKMDYDDEDIKSFTRSTAAEFKLNYMDGDVTLMGIDGTVDTPTTSFIKSLDYDDVVTKDLKSKANKGNLVEGAVPYRYLGLVNKNIGKTHKEITLHADTADLGAFGTIGVFKELLSPKDKMAAAATKNQALVGNVFMMPRVMADVSPSSEFLDYDVKVVANGKTYDLGKLERYNNEFVVSDLNGIYKDKAAKTADKEHYGDLKITSWW